MTRRILLFALSLLACCLAADASPLSSAPPEVSDLASFLASLQGPEKTVRSESTDSYCKVTLNCQAVPQYGSISCESYNSDCHSGYEYVECDGVRKNCPVCYHQCCGEVVCYGYSSCTTTTFPLTLYCDGVSAGTCRPRDCF